MSLRLLLLRRVPSLLLGAALACSHAPSAAAEGTTTMTFRPHCEKPNASECPAYETQDPTALRTPLLQPGDTLDLDIIVDNPTRAEVRRIRSWLSYDPQVLEGIDIAPGKQIETPLPGEVGFIAAEGVAKVGFVKPSTGVTDTVILVARVRFKVKEGAKSKSPIVFHEVKSDTTGRAYVLNGEGVNILTSPPVSLLALFQAKDNAAVPPATASSVAPIAAAGTTSSTVSPSPASAPSRSSAGAAVSAVHSSAAPIAFPLLQVQNVRVTTKDASMYVAWDALRTPQLQGYNLYYGTQMGRYIQRRSLAANATSAEIPNLATGVTYFAAVRAVNDKNQESAFSQEVAVQIGDPKSATAPLATVPKDGKPPLAFVAPQNPVTAGRPARQVPGEAGPADIALSLIAAAAIGALFAFRRQAIALSSAHDRH